LLIFIEMTEKKKRKKIEEFIKIPEGIGVNLDGNILKLNKDGKEIEKKLPYIPEIKENKLVFYAEKPNKIDKKMIKTSIAHINNMIKGLEEGYEYKLKICSVHFPMNVSVQNNKVIIKNFLGESVPREAKIVEGVEVKINGEEIVVKSHDKEKAGQTAANIEQATKIKNRDRRIFQDGIFITKKEKGRKEK